MIGQEKIQKMAGERRSDIKRSKRGRQAPTLLDHYFAQAKKRTRVWRKPDKPVVPRVLETPVSRDADPLLLSDPEGDVVASPDIGLRVRLGPRLARIVAVDACKCAVTIEFDALPASILRSPKPVTVAPAQLTPVCETILSFMRTIK